MGRCEQDLDAAFDAGEFFFVVELPADGVTDAIQQVGDLRVGERVDLAFGEAFGMGTFEQPRGGLPVAASEIMEDIDGRDLGLNRGLSQALEKLGVSAGFAADGDDAAAGVLGSGLERAAAGDHGTDFVLVGFGE